ncbi:efflux RND transporter permease subunit [Leeia sp. TBRC 13508]|uniref:Efflux pump membrane transporter n=1 Tax=Leeia speluncae TaxID=2884804 RepID=A0ABS8D4W5_9NEIS|nr:efflux RND transporter permease subunit [Leeia speluncae]MCB6183233.1 efflux RND transporter permease subunit [Leeia speluncae]
MARFFIDRPIFAWVVSILIMLAGVLSMEQLPVAQYPNIAPPSVAISATYPGASSKAAEDAVTQVIEQKMKGLDGLKYMKSTSSSNGQISITLTFEAGTNPDIAQVQVQNKLQQAMSSLPQEVQDQGVQVNKAAMNFMMVIGIVSTDGKRSNIDLADYASSNLVDVLSRVDGVGEVQLFGAQYAMRIWMDPAKLQSYQLTPAEVKSALEAQNTQVSAGQLGSLPAVKGQQLNAVVTVQSRLQTAEQFENILLKTTSDGAAVRLKDVARVGIGSESYDVVSRLNGKPAAGIGIKLATGANALETSKLVKAKLEELKGFFPTGISSEIPYDTTPFIQISIEEVIKTLAEAVVLVFLVMWLFLQNFRATLIPTIAVPVVLLGTLGILYASGYSINTLTMFGMVLAIGLLVDDAIVVVENVERIMSEEGLSPKEATRKSMRQITSALVGIALVLSAVFVPMAFFGGSTGVIYRQFSITIVSSMALSVLVAMTLTPALCATLLKPVAKGHAYADRGFFGWFNRWFDNGTQRYQRWVGGVLKRGIRFMIVFVVMVAGMSYMMMRLPTSFLPDEDQGIMFTMIQLPTGATQERTMKVVDNVEQYFLNKEKENVKSIFTVSGFSFAGSGQNMAIGFVRLNDWSQRHRPDQNVAAIAGRAMGALGSLRDAFVFAFAPPAVLELGTANGFDLQLQDRGGLGHEGLMNARNMLLGMASQSKDVMAVRPNGMEDSPQLRIDVDQQKAQALGLSISDINSVISTAWGSSYVNDFLDRGRVKKVYLQGSTDSRMKPEDLSKWYVKNTAGDMVPFSAFSSMTWDYGSPRLERYNGSPSVNIQGMAGPGKSTGQAMKAMEEMIAKLPPGVGYEWSGISSEELDSGSQTTLLYSLSILVVFLSLAALYESWSIPFAVILIVPLGVLGALLATFVRGLSNDIYFQVGLLTTIGLSAKNAILIVEFAQHQLEEGKELIDATLTAVKLRLRPILMTSLAFALGVLPLAISNGAGSGSQHAIGTSVLGGMLSATVLGLFFVPLFFVLIRKVFKPKRAVVSGADHSANSEEETHS